MSNIYIQEPATRGKVILDTTVGDIEIELFSKECPLACRNFLQLCMDGYYDGTIFHRIVPNFIAQGGDPTGTGDRHESSTGSFFADEFHTRLRFNRRGLLGMVNTGPNTNASQFFFTLGSTPELDKKNTLFAKVVGDTLFNMLKLGEGDVIDETPVYKHKILKTEIITNPFDNMVPRPRPKPQRMDEDNEERNKSKSTVSAKAIKNYGLLSFGNEAEEDEEEVTKVSMKFKQKGTGKSAHDLTNDATLSKSTVRLDVDEESDEELPIEKQMSKPEGKSDADYDKEELDRVRQKFQSKKLALQEKKKAPRLDVDDDEDDNDNQQTTSSKSNENVKLEIERLKKELKQMKKPSSTSENTVQEEEEEPTPPPPPMVPVTADTSVLMDELMAGTRRNTKKNHKTHSNSRESQTLDLLAKFRAKIHAAKDEPVNEPVNETKVEQIADTAKDQFLNHCFVSKDLLDDVQDIYTNADLLTVYDPRNPMTKRRREESSALLHQKKHKGRT
ncbi:unnamed protein product [Adineta steineri]|uniref:Spliceosome-associated protein CWC27 homolog n=1 Tax=Adineta steineri TaxID=433720 RepID=A0A814YCJ3_9BILA|nr:unnamed protein product [Adineta steineri]CAF1227391.1 unnamed protein product [Adineta steineri]CAF3626712.1 unnamed protein product [Adineta steineri]CAF3768700.1 unnamed protein product [Adineta steineri]